MPFPVTPIASDLPCWLVASLAFRQFASSIGSYPLRLASFLDHVRWPTAIYLLLIRSNFSRVSAGNILYLRRHLD